MKLISYNVNGIRSALQKGLLSWLEATNADCVCLQEVKAGRDQVDIASIEQLGYSVYWHAAEKKGYSGVAILTKRKPVLVHVGCGNQLYDLEGRVIRVDFEDFSLVNVYMPSGSSGEIRQGFKYDWLDFFLPYITNLRTQYPNLVIGGDYNICHRAIDIHNPRANANSSGFLPAEREWMGQFFESGFIDTFRHFNPEPHNYTWWSYRAGARDKNLGWRIDYFSATHTLVGKLKRAVILKEARHSDHCPVLLEIG